MIIVKRVMTQRELKHFSSFANKLYEENAYYVPELEIDVQHLFQPQKNPALDFCESVCFLAYQDQKIVGRIGVIINPKSNLKWHQKYARFTHFDFIDDLEVSQALFHAARTYAIGEGMDTLHGPLGFTDLDHQGMLVEGFNELDLFITIYNAPYYVTHMEHLGFVKDVDWIECQLKFNQEKADRLSKLSAYLNQKSAFKLIEFTRKKDLLPWAKAVFDLYNTAYAPLYGTSELSENQIETYIKTFFGYVNPSFIKIVIDKDESLAAFAIAMPSLSKAMQKAKGKLFPFGFIHILKSMRSNKILDLYLIAVKPEYQQTGINGLLLDSVIRTALKFDMEMAETGPMLELNDKVQAQWKFFDVRQHRRRRVWICKIDDEKA